MGILFENRYYNEKNLYAEYVKDVYSKHIRRLGAVCLITSIYYICSWIFKKENISELILPILGFFISLYFIFYYKFRLKDMERNSFNLHNGKITETVFQFTEDKIILREGTILMEFDYNQIKVIKEHKLTYALMIGAYQGLVLKKDSFSIGTLDEFKEFIVNRIKKLF